MYLIILLALILNILLYYLFIGVLTNCVNIVPACPKITTPQYLLYLRMQTKYLSACYAFYHLDNLLGRLNRNSLNQKMNVILITAYFHKLYFIPLTDLKTYLPQGYRYIFTQYLSPVFNRTCNMIQQQRFIMLLYDVFAHIPKVQISTPQQAARNFFD